MKQVPLADAKARLSELINAVMAGETVEITRRGRAVAKLVALEAPSRPIDYERSRQHIASMPVQEETAGDFVRRMREEERY